MSVDLMTAIAGCKDVSPSHVWVGFSFVNDVGRTVRVKQLRLAALYRDWYGECDFCPPNDAKITAVSMRADSTRRKFNVADGLEFGDFMDELEKHWRFRQVKED